MQPYDPKYPWRPTGNWDHCPHCFENFSLVACHYCGLGHKDYAPVTQRKEALADALKAELTKLRAENEALRNDAERYRWLRHGNAYFPEAEMIRGGEELDAAIDAAMKGQ